MPWKLWRPVPARRSGIRLWSTLRLQIDAAHRQTNSFPQPNSPRKPVPCCATLARSNGSSSSQPKSSVASSAPFSPTKAKRSSVGSSWLAQPAPASVPKPLPQPPKNLPHSNRKPTYTSCPRRRNSPTGAIKHPPKSANRQSARKSPTRRARRARWNPQSSRLTVVSWRNRNPGSARRRRRTRTSRRAPVPGWRSILVARNRRGLGGNRRAKMRTLEWSRWKRRMMMWWRS
uniref:(northern house mosquito) hypothetical protein n=1 Tax=Culex pipiens TaxID=7175 RepID=A0A8D8C3S5_CULPI